MSGRVILTAAEMRAAEDAAIAAGTPVETLMERAGIGAAEAIWRYAGPVPALVLCGPGNNGGDGYVIARELAARGVKVRVAASGEPKTPAAKAARDSWEGPVDDIAETAPAPLLIDALFGTGLTRPLDDSLSARLIELAAQARIAVAVDLPSGVATDDGAILSAIPDFDLTITFQTLKAAHLLQPAARHFGKLVVADIGIEAASALETVERPRLIPPGPDSHKYDRGFVLTFGGDLRGASALSAVAALRAGAGAVRLASDKPLGAVPFGIMQVGEDMVDLLADKRLGAVVFGPGIIPGGESDDRLDQCLVSGLPLVLDAGAITLLAERGAERLRDLEHMAILTPHAGEFKRLFGEGEGGKIASARAAAARSGAVVVFKGADTVIAAPDGRTALAGDASSWLATAGSGDVLAGAIGAMRARGLDAYEAAIAGVWLHGRAAQLAGPNLIADDLLEGLRGALVECL